MSNIGRQFSTPTSFVSNLDESNNGYWSITRDLTWWNTMDAIFAEVRVGVNKRRSGERTPDVDRRRVIGMLEHLSAEVPAEKISGPDMPYLLTR